MDPLPKFNAGKAPTIADEANANIVRKNFDAIIKATVVPPTLGGFSTTGDKLIYKPANARVAMIVGGSAGYYDVNAAVSEAGLDAAGAKTAIKTALDITTGGIPDGYHEIQVWSIVSSGSSMVPELVTILRKSS